MRRLPPLIQLRAFEAAARHASFKNAAEELHVSPTAISHQIKLLEDYLQCRFVVIGDIDALGNALMARQFQSDFVHPDIDLSTLSLRPKLELSRSYDALLPMTWIALLRGRVDVSFAATTGIHTAEDALKLLLVGADVTMVASMLYTQGIENTRSIIDGIAAWLAEHEYESVEQARGSLSQEHCPDPTAFERAGYMRTLASFTSRVV